MARVGILVCAFCLMALPVFADSTPFISDIPNQQLAMNTSTGPLSFQVSDEETTADDLSISVLSNNHALIPVDGDHIQLGGSGRDRTITITPADNMSGQATVGIVVRNNDGNNNNDIFTVTVLSRSESSQSLEN